MELVQLTKTVRKEIVKKIVAASLAVASLSFATGTKANKDKMQHASTPEYLAKFVQSEIAKWARADPGEWY